MPEVRPTETEKDRKPMKTLSAVIFLAAGLCAAQARPAPRQDSLKNLAIERIVVTGSRHETDRRHLPMTLSVVDRRQIRASRQPSLLPVLNEQVPGLFSTARGIMGYGVSGGASGQLSLRGIGGSPTTRMMVLIDGHPQYMGLMGHPIADACQSSMAERVEVLRGPASVLYGSNAMGGVVNIVTRRLEEEGRRTEIDAGYGSYNTLQSELTHRMRFGRFSGTVGGFYNRTDGHRPRMGFGQYGGQFKAGYALSSAWSLRADANLMHFDASQPGTTTAPLLDAEQHITRGAAAFALENDYGKSSGALNIFYNWGRHRIDDGYAPGSTPPDYRFHSRDEQLGVAGFQSLPLFPGNRLTLGVDYFRFGGKAWNRTIAGERRGERTLLADVTQHEVAGYVDFRQHLGRSLTLDAGLRVDHHSHVGTEWIPLAGLSFHLPHALELKLSAAKGFRYPTIREMYMFPPQNPDLKPERLWSYELALLQELFGGRLRYGINLFFIDGDNLIVTVPREGAAPLNMNTGRIENAGVEAELSGRLTPSWTVQGNYSFLHMKYPVIAAPEHKLHVGATFTRRRWMLSTGLLYVAGLYTSVKSLGYGTQTTERFLLWNLRGHFRAARWLSIWVRGENLLGQHYEINAGYPMPKATVTAGLNVEF